MAELVVKSRARSIVRESTENLLNLTFPLWGAGAPVMSIGLILGAVSFYQRSDVGKAGELLAYTALVVVLSLLCLLVKRALSMDMITVDRRGISLPRWVGSRFNLFNKLAWTDLDCVTAVILQSDKRRSQIVLKKKKGGTASLPLNQLQPEFIEQFVLATNMWAPDKADPSLDELQDVMRLAAHESSQSSYTELWEEELARRFCPTSYIPLEVGKKLRNSSLCILKPLSSGGLSALYLCQMNDSRLVALKEAVVPQQSSDQVVEKARQMFEREAQLLMKLDHPGIVRVLDYFCENERNYLVLDYINGADLRQLVEQNGPQKESDVLEWAVQIAGTLKHLHEREPPIIHRDLTPDNIVMRNDGKLIVVDFGAANEFIGTATGTFVGKHAYISPEQLRGKASTRSDIYAFGCSLFYLLTGQDPEALSPSNPRQLNSAVSEEFAELIESCTQLETTERYQSMAQLLPVLRRLSAQSMVS